MNEQTDYIIRLRPRAGVDGPAALQAALKALGRRHGLQAVEVRPVMPDAADASDKPATQSEVSR